jgi:SAM-dependent methyltransferase
MREARGRRWARGLALTLLVCAAAAAAEPRDATNRDRHGPADVDAYVERLLRPERVARLQPELVVRSLELPESAVVADLGTGPGVFAIPLARHLRRGLVYAVDVEPRQLDALRRRLVLASASNPHLPPGRLDAVLVVDTYHHLEQRRSYFRRLRSALREGGRLVILEYKPGDLPVGPPAAHKVAPEQREAELRAAGYALVARFETHEYHDFEVWRRAGDD